LSKCIRMGIRMCLQCQRADVATAVSKYWR
jgi:hypothetical protein